MEKLTKDQVRRPDVFISTVGGAWKKVESHRNLLLIFLGLLIGAGGGFSAYKWLLEKKEMDAQAAYYTAKKSLTDTEKKFEVDKTAVATAEKKNEKPPVPLKKSGQLDTDYGPSITQVEDVINKHAGTKAAALAALDLSNVLEEYKQGDRALTLLKKSSQGLNKNDLLQGFILLKIGNLQQAAGSCEEAIKSWTSISEAKELSFLHPEALLRQGLCYETLSQKPKAVEIYQKLTTDFADTDAGKSAKKYLRLLKNESA